MNSSDFSVNISRHSFENDTLKVDDNRRQCGLLAPSQMFALSFCRRTMLFICCLFSQNSRVRILGSQGFQRFIGDCISSRSRENRPIKDVKCCYSAGRAEVLLDRIRFVIISAAHFATNFHRQTSLNETKKEILFLFDIHLIAVVNFNNWINNTICIAQWQIIKCFKLAKTNCWLN